MDDQAYKDLERRVEELEERLEQMASGFSPGSLGTPDRPAEVVYLKAKGQSAVGKITFDEANTDVLVERVR